MNEQLLKSKKFRTAIIAAVTALLTFLVSEFGLELDVEKTIGLMVALTTPWLIYIGAEGYSEVEAKRIAEEKKIANKQGETDE